MSLDFVAGETPAPGIYFGLDSDRYHKSKALGSTDIKKICIDPVEFQWERLYGEEKDTPALIWGSALHARTLEGREAFEKQFVVEPSKSDYPDCLITADQLRAHMKKLGLKGGKTKPDYISIIRESDKSVQIWEDIMAEFERSSNGRTPISAKIGKEIETAAQWMQEDLLLNPLMKDGTFWAGSPEVSIFYNDNGVDLKARLDRLLPHAILDLKSFRATQRVDIRRAVLNAIMNMRYDLQAADYIRAWRAARELYKQGKVFGAGDYERELLDAAFKVKDKDLKWIWIFVKNSGAPQTVVRELSLECMLFSASLNAVDHAVNAYREFVEKYGEDKPWVMHHPAEQLTEQDFPPWAMQ